MKNIEAMVSSNTIIGFIRFSLKLVAKSHHMELSNNMTTNENAICMSIIHTVIHISHFLKFPTASSEFCASINLIAIIRKYIVAST